MATRCLIEMIKGVLRLQALLGSSLECPAVDLERHVHVAVRTFLFGVASGSAKRGAPVS